MDIQVSSNFERFLFEASGRDAACVRGKMGGLPAEPLDRTRATSCVPYRESFVAERVERGRGRPTASAA